MSHVSSVLTLVIHLVAAPQQPGAPSAPAAPPVTETVLVTATVAPVGTDSVARTVGILTRQDLDALGVSSVVDALRLVPGVDVRARGGRGVQTDFSIRGATFGQSLVLIDGIRLNDSQSGHHNGDIPIAVAGLDRIEVVAGGGSAVHGADALGGTINVMARTDRHATAAISAGQFGTVETQGSISGHGLPARWMLTGWGSRSGGFAPDRDYALGGAVLRGAVATGWTLDVRHERKAFGANGFYGNSPSKEWTDQTVAAVSGLETAGAWSVSVRGSVRHHGDHFRWDINRPGFAENRHDTNATAFDVVVDRHLPGGRRLSVGGSGGGDWVRSSNLGDHHYARGSVFGELQSPVGSQTAVQLGIRADGYSAIAGVADSTEIARDTGFGGAWSPSVSIGTWLTPGVRVRGSAAHAFRVPTFTELYYHDPANLGRADLRPERGWSFDAGLDWRHRGWTMSCSPFVRWDDDVIDWVRAEPTDLWRSTNVRDVRTSGVEVSASRRWSSSLLRMSYAALSVEASGLDLLSKYVKEYAKHSAGIAFAVPVSRGVRAAVTLDYRSRLDGQSYALAGLRVSRTIRRMDVFVEATNLLDESYQEIAGVAMPGRWGMVGISIR